MLVSPLPGRTVTSRTGGMKPKVTQSDIDEDMASFMNARKVLGG